MAHRLLTLCPPHQVSLPSYQMPCGTVKAKSDATLAISCRGLLCSDAQLCPTLCDPMYCIARQAPLSMDFPGNNTGVGCRFLLHSEDLPNPGIEPASLMSPELVGGRTI